MGLKLDFAKVETPAALKSSLKVVARSHSLRCDAKQAEPRFEKFRQFIESVDSFCLGDFLPQPFVKGLQPAYLETVDPDGVPVISTLAIQRLRIVVDACRFISRESFDAIDLTRKPRTNDVLLTLDGGTSIGKPVLFELDDEYAIDCHVAILRPEGLDPRLLVYLLASPLGQVQFHQAESGASGQTAVTEEDVRRFRFPVIDATQVSKIVHDFEASRLTMLKLEDQLKKSEDEAWERFNKALVTSEKASK
jgi:hypothetical protein